MGLGFPQSGELSNQQIRRRAASAALLAHLGLGLFGCGRCPSSLADKPLSLEPFPVSGKCFLRDLVLSHCLFGFDLTKCLTRVALRLGHRLGRLKLARCLCHSFAFSPISTSRRMASGRDISASCMAIQSSIEAIC